MKVDADIEFSILIGKILSKIEISNERDEIFFYTTDGDIYRQYHCQECCEYVYIEDICGNINDLVGSPIIEAEEVTSNENPPGIIKEYQVSFTWTFYKIATREGFVIIKWYGESNGYYSEKVDFCKEK